MAEGKCGVIITGASRGIGKSIALLLSSGKHAIPGPVDFCLISRSELHLESVKKEILNNKNDSEVTVLPTDLSDPSLDIPSHVSPFLKKVEDKTYATLYLFNNSGSVDPVCPSEELKNKKSEVNNALNLNISSLISLTSSVISSAKKGEVNKFTIVNITSLAAIVPFKNWALYCTGKAAREMFHKVIAAELGEKVRVLSYSPGVVHTQIAVQVAAQTSPMSTSLTKIMEKGEALTPDETVIAMLDYLKKDEYESGSRIDAYDLLPEKAPSKEEE